MSARMHAQQASCAAHLWSQDVIVALMYSHLGVRILLDARPHVEGELPCRAQLAETGEVNRLTLQPAGGT